MNLDLASSETATNSLASLEKCLNTCLRTPQNQRMNVMRAFVGVHHFEVHQMTRHIKLVRDAITAQHITRQTRHVQRFTA